MTMSLNMNMMRIIVRRTRVVRTKVMRTKVMKTKVMSTKVRRTRAASSGPLLIPRISPLARQPQS